MMIHVTGKDIRKQLTGNYGMGLFCTLLGVAILGFCAWFCGTSLGWKNLITVILMVLGGICVLLSIWMLLKMVAAGSHRAFKKYGSPEIIAEYINSGADQALFLSTGIINRPFDLMITERFIVSSFSYKDYLELKDIRSVQPTFLPDTQTVFIGRTPGAMLGAAVANLAAEHYRQTHPVDPNACYDYLIIRDADNVRHQYGVQRQDMETVMNILLRYAPQMTILEPKPV
ncbi:MAG: hypothetical protein IKI58_02915 [Oscillospiraceae bacterium]|nr:hypothetical protein [Oscillospiraceae bacterium]